MSEYGDTEQTMVPGTLRGYREWIPTPYGLKAVNFPIIWEPGVNTAQCAGYRGDPVRYESTTHVAPMGRCTCGFYARHTPFHPSFPTSVGGVIKASGRVILGTAGFRAQYAEIEALYFSQGWGTPMMLDQYNVTMLDQYNVPIYREFGAMVLDFPPISVDQLLPKPEDIRAWMPTMGFNFNGILTDEQVSEFLKIFNGSPPITGLQGIEEEQS